MFILGKETVDGDKVSVVHMRFTWMAIHGGRRKSSEYIERVEPLATRSVGARIGRVKGVNPALVVSVNGSDVGGS